MPWSGGRCRQWSIWFFADLHAPIAGPLGAIAAGAPDALVIVQSAVRPATEQQHAGNRIFELPSLNAVHAAHAQAQGLTGSDSLRCCHSSDHILQTEVCSRAEECRG